jgi:hypothetical protein
MIGRGQARMSKSDGRMAYRDAKLLADVLEQCSLKNQQL